MSAYDFVSNTFRIDVNGTMRSAQSLGQALDIAISEREPTPTNTAIVRIGDCVVAKVRGPHLVDFATPNDILDGARRYDERAETTPWGESTATTYKQLAAVLHSLHNHYLTRACIVAS